MEKIVFQERTTAEVKVAGRSVTGTPPVRSPVGPRDFPPPPPPPPTPLVVVQVKIASLDPSYLEFIFDAPAWTDGQTLNVTVPEKPLFAPGKCDIFGSVGDPVAYLSNCANMPAVGNHVVIPENAVGFYSLTGGKMVPGSYVVGAA